MSEADVPSTGSSGATLNGTGRRCLDQRSLACRFVNGAKSGVSRLGGGSARIGCCRDGRFRPWHSSRNPSMGDQGSHGDHDAAASYGTPEAPVPKGAERLSLPCLPPNGYYVDMAYDIVTCHSLGICVGLMAGMRVGADADRRSMRSSGDRDLSRRGPRGAVTGCAL